MYTLFLSVMVLCLVPGLSQRVESADFFEVKHNDCVQVSEYVVDCRTSFDDAAPPMNDLGAQFIKLVSKGQ